MEGLFNKLRTVRLIPVFFLFSVLIGIVFSQEKVIDKIVALVDDDIITLTDIRVASAFDLFGLREKEGGDLNLMNVLEKIIDMKVVLKLAKDEKIEVDDKTLDESWKKWRTQMGEDRFISYQKAFGLSDDDLKKLLKEKLIFDRILQQRITISIPVSIEEIRNYYNNVYLHQIKANQEKPKSLVEVMKDLEVKIRQEKGQEEMEKWLKSLRSQAEIIIKDKRILNKSGDDG